MTRAPPHLAPRRALAVSPGAAGAATGVPGAGRLPGPLATRSVVVEMPAAEVFVSLPVAQDMQRRAGGDCWQAGLRELQLLEVGVNRRVGAALTRGRCCLVEERRDEVRSCQQLYAASSVFNKVFLRTSVLYKFNGI